MALDMMPPLAMPPMGPAGGGTAPGPVGGAPAMPSGMEALMAMAQSLSAGALSEFAGPLDQAMEILGMVSAQVRLRNPEVARELSNAQRSILNARLKLDKGPPRPGPPPVLGALPGMGAAPPGPTGAVPGGPPMPVY